MNLKFIASLFGVTMLLGSIITPTPSAVMAESSVSDLPKNIGAATENAVDYVGDAALTAKIKGLFLAEKGLDSMDISVTTLDGAVELSGVVDHEAQKSLAGQIAGSANGVKSVTNKITVKEAQKSK